MRTSVLRLTALTAVLVAWTFMPAAEQEQPTAQERQSAHPGISSVTDGNGKPVPLRENAAGGTNPVVRRQPVQEIQRGQTWWPYASALPPYTKVEKRAEAMTADEIQVNGVTLLNVRDVEATLRLMPKALLLESGSQLARRDGFYLVKIKGFTRNQEQVDALTRAGAILGEYLNVNTYIAKIPSSAYPSVKALPFVTFVGDYQPAYKISPRIGLEEIPLNEAVDAATGQPKPWVFEVTLHNGVDPNDFSNELGRLGMFPQADDIVSNDALTVVLVRTVPEAVPALVLIPEVKWIAEKTYPQLQSSATSPATIPMVLQNNGVFTTTTSVGWKLWNAGIDGTGQIVTMMDTGLNTKMEHFSENTVTAATVLPGSRKVVGYDVYGGDQCVNAYTASDSGHGTWTSQHAVGSISNMTSSPDATHTPNVNWDNGIARGGRVYFQDIGDSAGAIHPPLDLGPSIVAAIGKGSFVQNNSWGTSSPVYDTEATDLDIALFNNPNFVVTISAGNRGAVRTSATIGSPCTAKNSICVGGNNVAFPDQLFVDCLWDGLPACSSSGDLGSSNGPVTGSGRVKPDIMTYVYASAAVGGEQAAVNRPNAMCQTDPSKVVYFDYSNVNGLGGTSFAAPEVAGLAALVRDYFVQGFYPTGTATPANTLTPSGSLVKAVILGSGEDMLTTSSPTSLAINKRYSNDVGYGRANLPGALHIGSGAPFLWVQNGDTLGDGATKSFFYNINGNSIPLRVMMVYYDSAGNALQKDTDLKVTIGGSVYWGNNFTSGVSGGWSTTATTVRDHTNPSEGVFLNAANGLPASGTVHVDVIGFNNPGGMKYSLVVVGDVASASVTQVALDEGKYTCNDTVKVTVNDAAATSPVSVTLVSKNSSSATIDTKIVTCTGANGAFTGTIQTGSGIIVVDGGSLVASYTGATDAAATVSCQVAVSDAGFTINGGCDNGAAGTDDISSPLFNGGTNEFYTKYMDTGENNSYTFKFKNTTGAALKDVSVNLSFSGAGAAAMTVYNNPVTIGNVPVDGVVGGVFQVSTSAVAGLNAVNLDFDVTSNLDGYTVPKRLTQVQLLQTNDTVVRQSSCATFNTSLSPFAESTAVSGRALNTWRWSGSATIPATVSSETRGDGACGSATVNSAAMVGNSGIAGGANFANNADSFLYLVVAPALRGNGPNGQPYHYAWKWHSFYHASETLSNQGGIWGAFYNDKWDAAANPSGDALKGFPIVLCCYNHTIFDYVATWNWDTANGGTPDDPHFNPNSGGAPNQLIVTFSNVTGLAKTTSFFSYGHEHADIFYFNGGTSHGTHRDIALDNDRLVYDEFYSSSQPGASCSGAQLGQIAFNQFSYDNCPTGSAVLSVVDANAVSGMQVTVTSPGTRDSEVVTLTGSAPYFSGTVTLSAVSGIGTNNGVLFVLPSESITATYTDTSPAGSTTAAANTGCTGGNVVYVSNTQVWDSGDNDGIPDNNETVTIDITIKNNTLSSLTNAKVKIMSSSPTVDCIGDPDALYGTIAAGASATNPTSDRFTFHIAPTVACTDFENPPNAQFTVVITGDGLDAPSSPQTFNLSLDLDPTSTGGTYNYTQDFNADPGWATSATPDDSLICSGYSNSFHWCAACGNGNGGYGAWTGNSEFGTVGQNYPSLDSSTLYSPPFVANGNVNLQFSIAYRTQDVYDGAVVQYKLDAGSWSTLAFTGPAQATTTTSEFCSPFLASTVAWTGDGTTWTATNSAVVPSTTGQAIQFRWRMGTDSSVLGTSYGGLGVDDVSILNLKQTVTCESTRNTPPTVPEAAGSQATIPKEWQHKLQNSPYDANHNQVHDLLEALPPTQRVDPLIDLTGCVGGEERTRLSAFGTIDFESAYLATIHMSGVLVSSLIQLARDPIVAFVEEDSLMYHTLSISNPAIQVKASSAYPPPPPPLAPITVHEKYTGIRGGAVGIIVVDTGVDDQLGPGVTHESLTRFNGGLICPPFGTTCTDGNPDDIVGMGTHDAAIALGEGEGGIGAPHEGIAPEAAMYDVQVQPDPAFLGRFRTSRLIVALAAITKKMNIMFGGWNPRIAYVPWSNCHQSNGTDAISVAVNQLVDRGVLVVTSMGNCSTCLNVPGSPCTSCPCSLVPSPAAADLALTVGASWDHSTVLRDDDTLSDDSLRGPRQTDGDTDTEDEHKPDLVAPGVNIESAQANTTNGYVNMSGSSMAAAHVAGCAALATQLYGMPPLDLKALLVDTADRHGLTAWDPGWGIGILNCFQAVDRVNDGLWADVKFDGVCGNGYMQNPCHYHPALHAKDWLVEGVEDTILADIKNDGPGFANPFKVRIRMDLFSNHDDGYEICNIDVPTLAPGAAVQASCKWTPSISGGAPGVVGACLFGDIISDDDCCYGNNHAQHNEEIQQSWSPAISATNVENPTQETLTMELQGTFDCAGGPCPGWTFSPSSNFFPMVPGDCAATVLLQATPTPPGAAREAKVHVYTIGHTVCGETRDLGGVTMVARLACATSNLFFTSKTSFTWSGLSEFSACESGFDVTRGSLPIPKFDSTTLRGDFSSATCLANDISDAQFSDSTLPAPGSGFYYLTRAGGSPAGSWDVHDAQQKGLADDTLKSCQ